MLRIVIASLLVAIGSFSFGWSMGEMIMGDEGWWMRLAFAMILLGLWYAGSKEDK